MKITQSPKRAFTIPIIIHLVFFLAFCHRLNIHVSAASASLVTPRLSSRPSLSSSISPNCWHRHRHQRYHCRHRSNFSYGKNNARTTSSSSPLSSSLQLRMGLEINIRMVGRKNSIESTSSYLQEGYDEYTKRLSSTIQLSTTYHKSNDDLLKGLQVDSKKGFGIICLDENGAMYNSNQFSKELYGWMEEYGSRLVFVIGAAEGLPAEIKQYQYQHQYQYNNQYGGKGGGGGGKKGKGGGGILNRSPIFMSLSKMTFTHPWARTILVEQIYRASEIHKGSGYHKD